MPELTQTRFKAGDRFRIPITVTRETGEPNFDRACSAAYQRALMLFGADDDGHLNNVEDSQRFTDAVVVRFVEYLHYGGMGGQQCVYRFETWVERTEDDGD